MKCLICAEGASRALVKSTKDIAGRLRELGHEAFAVVFAAPDRPLEELGALGADEVIVLRHEAFATYDPGQWGRAFGQIFAEGAYGAALWSHTFAGRELAARFAQQMAAPLASDVIAIDELREGTSVARRPVHGGKVYEAIETKGSPVLISVRPGAWHSATAPKEVAVTERGDIDPGEPSLGLVAFSATTSERPSLDEAEVVVAVGRGCSAKAREYAGQLADLLGAALGSSRGMVDSGLEGYETQVGQTGKTIAPHLYIACGISGSIQHQAGMARSDYIVAINTDENAPIFDIADLGIQADAEDTLRALVDLVASKAGHRSL